MKASAGAVEHLLLAPVDDLAGALADLHVAGLRIVGAEAEAPLTVREADLHGPIALVVGSEGQGLGPAVRRRCDLMVRIPMRGAIGSLNASVAGSILLFEATTQRGESAAMITGPRSAAGVGAGAGPVPAPALEPAAVDQAAGAAVDERAPAAGSPGRAKRARGGARMDATPKSKSGTGAKAPAEANAKPAKSAKAAKVAKAPAEAKTKPAKAAKAPTGAGAKRAKASKAPGADPGEGLLP